MHSHLMRAMRTRLVATALVAASWGLASCNRSPPSTQGPKSGPAPTPPSSAIQNQPDDGQWLMAAKDYANTRYSGLQEITTENVRNLKLAWSFSTGVLRGQEAAPLVVGSTMYVITPYPNVLYALDLTQPGAPVKWTFKPKPAAASQGVACCDVVNRGAVFSKGKVIFNTLDGQTIAVDSKSGKQVWRTRLANIQRGETITMAPIVANNKVIVGNS